MIIMAFDLSSVCVGVTAVEMKRGGVITKMRSCPIMPPNFDPTILGYMKSKKKLKTKDGKKELNTYYKHGETVITVAEKTRRDKEVRAQKDIYVMQKISQTINSLIGGVRPDIVLVEKNAIFNGILTSILLGKVMGCLISLTGIYSIPLHEYPVGQARSVFNLAEIIRAFQKRHTYEELQSVPDITKRALREYLEEIYGRYGIVFQTDDESDSCVVFHYWLNKVYDGS
ncbi:MAG: hypothetical protein K0R00_144 [Herbinix sp.]|jgi:Holliday junction resolvasome RuvABC endonuclease subunit|nr:hypothetical protein [Herbinix sp.]